MENSVYYTGIDAHKSTCFLVTRDDNGKIVKQANLRSDAMAIKDYLATLSGTHRVVVESTSSWYWISDLLYEEGIALTLAHSKYLKAISYAKVKTDRVDAATLSQLHWSGLVPEAHQISRNLRASRDLLRARLRLVQRRTAAMNSVSRVFEKFNSGCLSALEPEYQELVGYHREQIELFNRQIKQVERSVSHALRPNQEVAWLRALPGIGRITAWTIYLEVDGIERFGSLKQFCSYARLVPGSHDSGPKQRHKRSKDGNRYLKIAFSNAAVRAIQHYPKIKVQARRWERRKNRPIARALVAKELAKLAYVVLTKKQPFNGRFKNVELS